MPGFIDARSLVVAQADQLIGHPMKHILCPGQDRQSFIAPFSDFPLTQ